MSVVFTKTWYQNNFRYFAVLFTVFKAKDIYGCLKVEEDEKRKQFSMEIRRNKF